MPRENTLLILPLGYVGFKWSTLRIRDLNAEITLRHDSDEKKLQFRSHETPSASGAPPQIRIIDGVVCKSGWLEFYEDYSGYSEGTFSKGGVKTYFAATGAHLIARYESELFTSYMPLFKTRHAGDVYARFKKVMTKAE